MKPMLNPYLPCWEFIPDGEPYVFGDRVYVYGSHDRFNGWVFCLNDYVCWSAPVDDLGSWRYEGVIYRKEQDPRNPDGRMCLYAPDVTQGANGRYYLFYVLDKISIVSVAVSDFPAGPFEFHGYVHDENGGLLGERPGDEPQFDPGVLTEGDTTYLFTGFCSPGDTSRHGPMLTLLGPDMLTIVRETEFVAPSKPYSKGSSFEGHEFFEAPSIRKRGGKYYFVYSSILMCELCYAVSDRPDGPFTYGGVIVSNNDWGIDTYKPAQKPMCYGGNNHGSIVEINGQWYIFYHRHTNNTWYSRQACAEPITFLEDGSIPQVEITSCGLNGKPLEGRGTYPAYIACHLFTREGTCESQPDQQDERHPAFTQEGEDRECDPNQYIQNMRDGATAGFKYFAMDGAKAVTVETRGDARGEMVVRDGMGGPVVARVALAPSDGWAKHSGRMAIGDGRKALYFTYEGEGYADFRGFVLE